MSCLYPLKGWRARQPFGAFTLDRSASTGQMLTLSCGHCVHCKMKKTREWALRSMHEAQMHDRSCMLTLTYNEASLPPFGELRHSHFQSFMKRYRKAVWKKYRVRVKFFMCGEYGSNDQRPHYHALVFGFDHPEKYHWRRTKKGHAQYRDELLDKAWDYGHAEIGTCTWASAQYIAGYIWKKQKADDKSYLREDDKGNQKIVKQEYIKASNGIGKSWYHSFKRDCVKGYVTMEGRKFPVPRYYRKLMEKYDPELYAEAEKNLKEWARRLDGEDWYETYQREVVLNAKLDMSDRGKQR